MKMMGSNRLPVVAQPTAEREWQVLGGEWDRPGGDRVIGFIEELGGTYEVKVIDEPALRQYFELFKDAMEYFESLQRGHLAKLAVMSGVEESGASC